MSKQFDPNNPKDMKALKRMKRKSERRAKVPPLTRKQKRGLIVAFVFFCLAILFLCVIKDFIVRSVLAICFGAFASFELFKCFVKLPKMNIKKEEMLEFENFPNRIACGKNNDILVNEQMREIIVTDIYSVRSPVLNFSDIAKLEVLEDNDSKVKYSIAGALVGDWTFGTLGAIIGAKHWSKTKNYCTKLELVVYFNNFDYSNVIFTFIDKKTDKNSVVYKDAIRQIKDCYGRLQAIMLTPKTDTATNKK